MHYEELQLISMLLLQERKALGLNVSIQVAIFRLLDQTTII